jgi:hypothetical protein
MFDGLSRKRGAFFLVSQGIPELSSSFSIDLRVVSAPPDDGKAVCPLTSADFMKKEANSTR